MKFFNVAESNEYENYDFCAKKVLDLLQTCVPDRVWQLSDIVRVHRQGSDNNSGISNYGGSNGSDNDRRPTPGPITVKFAHWGGGGAKRRDGLERHCIAVAGDLTTRQQNITKQYRDDGIRAYYKGNQLVVGGRLRPRLQIGRKQDDAGEGGGRGTQASQFPSFPIYSEVAQRSAIDGNATDVTTTTAWTQF